MVSPSSIPRRDGKSVKTDRIDAAVRAEFDANGLLTIVTAPDAEVERKTRWRTHHYGCLERTIEGRSGNLKANLSLLLRQPEHLGDILAAYDEEIEALAVTPRDREPVHALTCYKGIKHLFAMTMITEIGDVKRFALPRQLA